jgi:uncharacterized repeat protein (TIGR03803 family)
MPKKETCTANSVFVIFFGFLLLSVIAIQPAQGRKFKVLHTFHGAPADGEGPFGVLILDTTGNIYGTTSGGGTGKCNSGCGTAFKLDKAGKLVWMHSFGGKNGRYPLAGLFRDKAGNLNGTTVEGGAHCYGMGFPGCGAVYQLDKAGKETLLYSFAGIPDGWNPEALLVGDSEGNLYGTTYEGGTFSNAGTVFKVDKSGSETVLHNFCSEKNCADGNTPYPSVIRDAAGNLYGVTIGGGTNGAGVVYELDSTGKESVLYSFSGGSDGGGPDSVLVADPAGNLYGTTQGGGNLACGCGNGSGVVSAVLRQTNGSWTGTTLYTFCSLSNCTDGERPIAGPLFRDRAGNLYGTTFFGGGNDAGVVFKLDKSGKETVLHSFTGGKDGAFPWAGLTMDNAGNLYGVATGGGDTTCFPPSGCGVVFKIIP